MIVFDTETTGLPEKGNVPVEKQPHIIEFAAIKLNDETLEEIDRIEFLAKPPINLPPIITQITGLTDADLENEKPFAAYFDDLANFFFGEKYMVAHNVAFDRSLLVFELRRLSKLTKFPWPMNHICTVEQSYSIRNHRMKLMDLHEELIGEKFSEAHRAMADVEALTRCVVELNNRNMLI